MNRPFERALVIVAGGLLLLLLGLSLVPEEPAPQPIAERPTSTAMPSATRRARVTRTPQATEGPLPPFPTAQPLLQQRLREWDGATVALVDRGGLQLSVTIDPDTIRAGHVISVEVRVSNSTTQTFDLMPIGLALSELEERTNIAWWPVDWDLQRTSKRLAPGESHSQALPLYVPDALLPAGHAYVLWVETSFAPVQHRRASGGLGWRLEAGPIPLQVQPGDLEQEVQATLVLTGDRWDLTIQEPRPGIGAPSLEGIIVFEAFDFHALERLAARSGGHWQGRIADLGPFPKTTVRALIWGEGYRASMVEGTLTREGWPNGLQEPQRFPSREAAEAALRHPLAWPQHGLEAAVLESVEVITPTRGDHSTTQRYRFPTGQEVTFFTITGSQDIILGYHQLFTARPDMTQVELHGTRGYSEQVRGRIRLSWFTSSALYTLDAPRALFTLEELWQVASSVA